MRRQHPEPSSEKAADKLAGGASRKNQCQCEADFRYPRPFCPQKKRQEGQKPHSRRAVDDTDHQQKKKAVTQQTGTVADLVGLAATR